MDGSASLSPCQRARKLFESGFIQPALEILADELTHDPDQGELWLLKASILHSQENWQDALIAIETASALIPLTLGGQLVLADCYSHLEKHELALVAYEHLLANDQLPLDYYAGLYAGFKRAWKFELALATCRKAIELSPENDEAYFGMAHCMSWLAFPPRQITTILRKAVDLAPDRPHYRISLAIQLSLTKRRREAHEVLKPSDSEGLKTITCRCVARQLLELCAWAGDEQRCGILGVMIAKLERTEQQKIADKEAKHG